MWSLVASDLIPMDIGWGTEAETPDHGADQAGSWALRHLHSCKDMSTGFKDLVLKSCSEHLQLQRIDERLNAS